VKELNMSAALTTSTRAIVYRTLGSKHGPITRLMSPSDLGEHLKPFVFLDHFEAESSSFGGFGMHPHSGIATVTWMMQGSASYEDTTGKKGLLPEGGVEWMQAGGGVWHTSTPTAGVPMRGFQLWVALPPAYESAAAYSSYMAPDVIPQDGPARVLLGQYGGAKSTVVPPSDMNYLAVNIKAGESWTYLPPAGHSVAWAALSRGAVAAGGLADTPVAAGELVVFDSSAASINLKALQDAELVIGSAVPHGHDLVLGRYSVHTSREALQQGEATIRQMGVALAAQRRLQNEA
jgi:redox-sensitive bicupin YhaK (pirin superfamily)